MKNFLCLSVSFLVLVLRFLLIVFFWFLVIGCFWCGGKNYGGLK